MKREQHLSGHTELLQQDEIDSLMDALTPVFGVVKYVEDRYDGFEESFDQAYIRPEAEFGGYEFNYITDDMRMLWLVGRYVIVAEGEADKLRYLLSVLRSQHHKIEAISRLSDFIYQDETGEQNRSEQKLMRVLFEIHSPEQDCELC